MRRILSILLENEPGALSRIVGLFSQRAYNIDSLTVGTTDDESLSRITVTTKGDDRIVEQITKQVNKLVDVLKVIDLTDMSHIERELLLVKVFAKY
jgi:acetolactate synthase-1/3 small subunit